MQYNTMQYNKIQYNAIQYDIIDYTTGQTKKTSRARKPAGEYGSAIWLDALATNRDVGFVRRPYHVTNLLLFSIWFWREIFESGSGVI
jgi:hypothetical protein